MKTAILPGSFDPFTNGHQELVNEGLKIFDKLIIAIGISQSKRGLFTVEERMEMIRSSVGDSDKIEIKSFSGLVVDFAASEGATALLRGLRSEVDFSYELPMAIANRKLNDNVMTIFLPTSVHNHYISSSLVKEVASHGGDVSEFVSDGVLAKLKGKF